MVKATGKVRASPLLWGPVLLFQNIRHSQWVPILGKQSKECCGAYNLWVQTDRLAETEMQSRKQQRLTRGTRLGCGDGRERKGG